MIRINLLPVRAARKKETFKQNIIVAVVCMLALCFLLAYYNHIQKQEIGRIEQDIKKKKAEIARLKSVIGEVSQLKKRKKSLEDRIAIIEKLMDSRKGPVRMMDELSNVIPQKAWITSLSDNGSSISLSCNAVNEEVVSDFMVAMEKSPYFSNVKLNRITTSGTTKVFGLSARRIIPKD